MTAVLLVAVAAAFLIGVLVGVDFATEHDDHRPA